VLFQSFPFLFFFPFVVLLYYLVPRRLKTPWLLLASYFYYVCWDWRYMAFLLFSTLSTWAAGRALGAGKGKKKLIVALCVLVNVGILAVFKYAHFAVGTVNLLLAKAGLAAIPNEFSLILPVGISFYTLQAVGYLFDVYRGKIPAEKDLLTYALFVSFFPQTLSGPIGRGAGLLPQFREPKPFDYERMRSGLLRMLWGLFVKLVITERLAVLADKVFGAPTKYEGLTLVLAAVAYGLQIYCDFSSYSNMAVGAGEVLGIEMIENFKTPYFSLSVGEFWRRWHISLSSWFRDYLYIPLGGSRKGTLRKYRNVLIVFAVSGLWHGANWTFVVWGLLNGLLQVVEAMTAEFRAFLAKLLNVDPDNWGNRFFRMVITFLLVDFCWIFFRSTDIAAAFTFIKRMFVFNPMILFNGSLLKLGLDLPNLAVLLVSLLVLLGVSIANYHGITVRHKLAEQGLVFRWAGILIAIFAVLVFGMYGPAYDASSFIYAQF
jgi:D-alanyl-lipoteichoic acid acyltransferase DltB (MBOAT superfamily)